MRLKSLLKLDLSSSAAIMKQCYSEKEDERALNPCETPKRPLLEGGASGSINSVSQVILIASIWFYLQMSIR